MRTFFIGLTGCKTFSMITLAFSIKINLSDQINYHLHFKPQEMA
jgi:hypothetical protein